MFIGQFGNTREVIVIHTIYDVKTSTENTVYKEKGQCKRDPHNQKRLNSGVDDCNMLLSYRGLIAS